MRVSRRKFLAGIGTATGLAAGAVWPSINLGSPWLGALRAAGIPIRIGVTDWNLRQSNKVEALALAKRLGFDGVEISFGRELVNDRMPLTDPEMQKQYLAASRKHGVAIAGTHLGILHKNILKSDPLGQRWVADAIPVTKNLGTRVILVPFFGKGALTTREERDRTAGVLRELAPEAEKAGVVLGLENTISAKDNLWILDRVQSKSVLVYYDVGNSTRNGFDILKEIRWLGRDRICQFHLKDNPHFMGEGKIDFPGVVRAIADIGYSGWAMLETGSPTNNLEGDLKKNLSFIQGIVKKQWQ